MRKLTAFGIALCSQCLSVPISASNVDIDTANFDSTYVVMNQQLSVFLSELSRDTGRRIQYSDDVRGRILDARFVGPLDGVLDTLAVRHNLDWFEFNDVIFVSAKSSAATRIIRLGDLKYDDAIAALDTSKLLLQKYPIFATGEQSALSVTGPPRYIAIIETVIESIPSEVPEVREVAEHTIRIRRGIEVEAVVIP